MSYQEASDRVIESVNEALDAGLQGRARPESTGPGSQLCTGDLVGPTDKVSPNYAFTFPLSHLGDAADSFADNVDTIWENRGMEIIRDDDPPVVRRFASTEEGFRFSVTVNREAEQVHLGGSGPCVDSTQSDAN